MIYDNFVVRTAKRKTARRNWRAQKRRGEAGRGDGPRGVFARANAKRTDVKPTLNVRVTKGELRISHSSVRLGVPAEAEAAAADR